MIKVKYEALGYELELEGDSGKELAMQLDDFFQYCPIESNGMLMLMESENRNQVVKRKVKTKQEES